jgi:hypothetical protein
VDEDLLEALALERHQALVEAPALHVLERDREAAVAEEAALAQRGAEILVVGRHASDSQFGGTVGHEQLHRARTLHLQCDPSRALLVGAEQDVEGGGVAKKRRNVLRVVAAVEHPLPGAR